MALKTTSEAARKLVKRDLSALAPKMQQAVQAALRECSKLGLDAYVYETMRSDELARMYFELGVSKAPNALRTWHHYGLAVDVISLKRAWKAWDDPEWMLGVVEAFKAQGMKWGGDWERFKDYPHFQWERCKLSPSARAVELLREGGVVAVWKAVGAV